MSASIVAVGGPAFVQRSRPLAVLIPVGLASFVTSLDNTIVNVSLPAVGRDLRLSTTGLEWVAAAYVVSFAALLIGGGWLADVVGRRRVLLLGLGLFALCSAMAGAAPSGGLLIAARIGQGFGSALVVPSTLAVVAADLDERHRAQGVGVWAASVAAALALGPLVGGTVTEHLGWRWVFFLAVPVSVLAAVMAHRAGLGGRERGAAHRSPDIAGLVTSGAAMAAVTAALISGPALGWGSPAVLFSALGAVVLAAAFVVVELRSPAPAVDLRLFADPAFSGATIAQMLWGLGLSGVFFYTSLFLQTAVGWSPTQTGAAFLPLAAVLVAVVPMSAGLARRMGVGPTVAAGLLAVGAGLALVARFGPGDSFLVLLPGLVLLGAGSGLTTPLVSYVLGRVDSDRAGMASGVTGAAREISGALGIAVVGAILLDRRDSLLRAGVEPLRAFTGGYHLALDVAAGCLVLAAVVVLVTIGPRRS